MGYRLGGPVGTPGPLKSCLGLGERKTRPGRIIDEAIRAHFNFIRTYLEKFARSRPNRRISLRVL
jgi:hypothetical protein